MRKLVLIALLGVASPVLAEDAPAAAVADIGDVAVGTVLGTTLADVRSALAGMGYEVRRGEMDDGLIEVYFVAEGRMAEVYVDARTGAVTRLSIN